MTKKMLAPHIRNSKFLADLVSYGMVPEDAEPAKNTPFFDPFFGYQWQWTPRVGAGLYGRTDLLESQGIERLGTGEFLRVPFRRIPIIDVCSRSSFDDLVQSFTNGENAKEKFLWRGQSKLYFLDRSNEELSMLYGDEMAKEPSLLTSASRQNVDFKEVIELWSGVLEKFIAEKSANLNDIYGTQPMDFIQDADALLSHFNFRLWAISLAQHYGLPSNGLDLTPDPLVALYFALNRLSIDPVSGKLSVARCTSEAEPVIFVMGDCGADAFDDDYITPEWLKMDRPRAQSAHFFHSAWGDSKNKAAEKIVAAIRLKDHTTWANHYKTSEMFPPPSEDEFLSYLLSCRSWNVNPMFKKLMDSVYYL